MQASDMQKGIQAQREQLDAQRLDWQNRLQQEQSGNEQRQYQLKKTIQQQREQIDALTLQHQLDLGDIQRRHDQEKLELLNTIHALREQMEQHHDRREPSAD